MSRVFKNVFVQCNVCGEKGSALFTYFGTPVQLASPLSDVILALLACPLNNIMFCLHSGITSYLFTSIISVKKSF
jgi:hypothetical protein